MYPTQFMPDRPPATAAPAAPVSSSTAAARRGVLRAAVIGTGKISEEHLKFLSGRDGVQLGGVCDLSPSLAKYAA